MYLPLERSREIGLLVGLPFSRHYW